MSNSRWYIERSRNTFEVTNFESPDLNFVCFDFLAPFRVRGKQGKENEQNVYRDGQNLWQE